MENKIRIGGGVKRIEVNDEGEYIVLPLSDDSFVLGFYRLMDFIRQSGEGMAEDVPGEDTVGSIDGVEKIVALEQETRQKVDELFGADTCRKVFGDILPSMDLFVEFFGSLVPFLEEYKEARTKKMGKYAADRTGSAL